MRFNCPDSWSPFGAGGINTYAYCEGDPSGHLGIGGWFGIVAGIIGLTVAAVLTGGAVLAAGALEEVLPEESHVLGFVSMAVGLVGLVSVAEFAKTGYKNIVSSRNTYTLNQSASTVTRSQSSLARAGSSASRVEEIAMQPITTTTRQAATPPAATVARQENVIDLPGTSGSRSRSRSRSVNSNWSASNASDLSSTSSGTSSTTSSKTTEK